MDDGGVVEEMIIFVESRLKVDDLWREDDGFSFSPFPSVGRTCFDVRIFRVPMT